MKKVIAWIMCMALALGMVGCGNTNDSSDNDSDAVDTDENGQDSADADNDTETEKTDYSDVEFRIAWWGGDARNTQTVDIIENFEKQYPNLKIDVEYGDINDYFTKLTTQATAGNLPDVYMMDYSRIAEFVNSGQMEPLDAYIDSGAIDLSDVDETLISGGEMNGSMYAIATGVNAPCLMYDASVLEDLNLTLSQTPTWEELIQVIQDVYEANGMRAYLFPPSAVFEMYVRSLGKNLFTEDGTSFGYDAEDMVGLMEICYDLYESGAAMSSAEWDGENYTTLQDGTDIWIEIAGTGFTNLLASYETGSAKPVSICCHATAEGSTVNGTYLKPTMLWGISATSENKELAAEFINYFVNDTYVYDVCGTDRGVPISAAMREYLDASADETGKKVSEFISFLSDGVASPISAPEPSGAAEAKTYITEAFELLAYGQIGRDEFLSTAEEAIEQGNAVLENSAASE